MKGGFDYGKSDEIGFKAAVDKVNVHGLHVTILAALGLDQRLASVEKSRVVKEVFA